MAVIISLLAILVSLVFKTSTKQELAEEFYLQIAKKKHPEDDKPYIKALINMKCREFYVNLPNLFHTNPELFTQDALLRRLYD